MKHDTLFLAHQAAHVANRNVREIARLGQIVAPERPAGGKGFRARYSFSNLVQMRIAEEMARFGVPRKRIGVYLSDLRYSFLRWLEVDGSDGWIIVSDNGQWSVVTSFEILREDQLESSALLSINIGKIKTEMRNNLK